MTQQPYQKPDYAGLAIKYKADLAAAAAKREAAATLASQRRAHQRELATEAIRTLAHPAMMDATHALAEHGLNCTAKQHEGDKHDSIDWTKSAACTFEIYGLALDRKATLSITAEHSETACRFTARATGTTNDKYFDGLELLIPDQLGQWTSARLESFLKLIFTVKP